MLYSEWLDEENPGEMKAETEFARYVDALEQLEEGKTTLAEAFLNQSPKNFFFETHLRAKRCFHEKDYFKAKTLLEELFDPEAPILNEVELYAVLKDLEIACREIEDYKNAYRYANEKVQLYEQLLRNDDE